jgi:purine-cytosine permease-like protein
MSHAGSVDIIDFVLLTIYPVGALFIIEITTRLVNKNKIVIPSWIKLSIQGIVMVAFAVAYTVFISLLTTSSDPEIYAEPHWLSAFVLLALAVTLFYQARRSKQDPRKSDY